MAERTAATHVFLQPVQRRRYKQFGASSEKSRDILKNHHLKSYELRLMVDGAEPSKFIPAETADKSISKIKNLILTCIC